MSDKHLPSSRAVAASLLDSILTRNQAFDIAIANEKAFDTLEPRDRAFVQLLLKTTLRHLGQIDALIDGWLTTPLPAKSQEARQILRLGITQLLWLNTPPHAAVHSSVEQAKAGQAARFASLINALLQRASREGAQVLLAQDADRLNTPAWLWESWISAYGEAETRAIAQAHRQEPPLDITVKENAAHWAEALQGALLPSGSIRLSRPGNITELPGFAEGAWWVQDAAASLPAQLLENIAGKYVLDMCAAPGGKTAQLAAQGARVTALDISASRLKIVEENLARLRLQAECIAADACKWQPATPPDAILLDAPCSATGTIRRHPDVAWHRAPADVARLTATQARLLAHAGAILAPGGLIAYAVCSLQPEEGEQQIARFLAENPHFRQLHATVPLAQPTPHGLRTLPSYLGGSGGMDGFFMALLQKSG